MSVGMTSSSGVGCAVNPAYSVAYNIEPAITFSKFPYDFQPAGVWNGSGTTFVGEGGLVYRVLDGTFIPNLDGPLAWLDRRVAEIRVKL